MPVERKTILYRGSLKSCNYRCTYCPFAKNPVLKRQLEKDREEWLGFCDRLKTRAGELGLFGLMVVPYGEALNHRWYWEGLGEIARLKEAEAVGAQTNFSFSLKEGISSFRQAGGRVDKLHLWVTFHPEMVSVKDFAQKCREALKEGITLCTGAVGVPDNLPRIKELRCQLPQEIYLWVNPMEGLKRPYTWEEEEAFSLIDPLFIREMEVVPAEPEHCKHRVLVEGSGRMRTCNISHALAGNWHQEDFSFPLPQCRRKTCSCYLAYGGRGDWVNGLLFGEYPVFRVPQYYSAVFLDIDGTLIPEGESRLPSLIIASLKALAGMGSRLFFATSLPLPEARRKCREVWEWFDGGIFAGGACLRWKKEHGNHKKPWDQERLYFIEEGIFSVMKEQENKLFCRLCVCKNKGKILKITLVRQRGGVWEKEEEEYLKRLFTKSQREGLHFICEKNCLQILPAEASKEKGVKLICRKLGIPLEKTAAVGNSPEDEGMLVLCSKGIKLSCIK